MAKKPKGVKGTIVRIPELLSKADGPELALAVVTVAILWFTPGVVKRFCPPQLLALVVGTLLYILLPKELDLVIGEFSATLPSPQMPHFDGGQLSLMLVDGAVWACSAASMRCSPPWWLMPHPHRARLQ